MPNFGFSCKRCGKRFDKILSSSEILSVTCSACGSPDIKRVFTLDSILANKGATPIPAGALSGGSCKSGFS